MYLARMRVNPFFRVFWGTCAYARGHDWGAWDFQTAIGNRLRPGMDYRPKYRELRLRNQGTLKTRYFLVYLARMRVKRFFHDMTPRFLVGERLRTGIADVEIGTGDRKQVRA